MRTASLTIISLAAISALHANEIATSWIGTQNGSQNWTDSANWNNGVPNNGAGNTYTASIFADYLNSPNLNSVVTLENLTLTKGRLNLDGSSLTIHRDFSNSDALNVRNSSLVEINGDLSNTGSISAEASTQWVQLMPLIAKTASVIVDGAVAQQVDHVLTGGVWSVTVDTPYTTSKIAWSGADVQVIGQNATIRLSGNTASLADTTGQSALRNLSRIDGNLKLANHDLSVPGSLTVSQSGTLTLATSHLSANATIEIEGSLLLKGTPYSPPSHSILDGTTTFHSTGSFDVSFIRNSLSVGGMTADTLDINGAAFLGGTLALNFDSISSTLPTSDLDFTILTASSLNGFFENAGEGDRVAATGQDPNLEEVTYGTFAVHYTATQVVLTDFEAIPEPSTIALMILGFGLLGWRISSPQT